MDSKKKQNGYWDNFANVELEVLAFIEECGTPSIMPKNPELCQAGRLDLTHAIQKHGGYAVVAKRLGLTCAKQSIGHWDDFSSVESEVFLFIKKHGSPGVMPMIDELRKAGRGDLDKAIQKHDGYRAVAERLGLKLAYTKRPLGYWNDFANLEREFLAFVQKHGTRGVMPTNLELRKAGRNDLANAVHEHSGCAAVAERLGLKLAYARKLRGYWNDFANVKRELFAFIEEHGTPDVMPTQDELKKAGRNDLADAIHKHSGYAAVAERLGLQLASFVTS